MINSRILPGMLAALALSGCSAMGAASETSDLEPLLGLTFEAGNLRLHVVSNGCTTIENFALDVRRDHGAGFQTLAVTRIKPDVCRAMPHEKILLIDTAELAPDVPVRLQNPFSRPPSIKRTP